MELVEYFSTCPGSVKYRASGLSWEEYFGNPEGEHLWFDFEPYAEPGFVWCDLCEATAPDPCPE